jgi:hypothetical protein
MNWDVEMREGFVVAFGDCPKCGKEMSHIVSSTYQILNGQLECRCGGGRQIWKSELEERCKTKGLVPR